MRRSALVLALVISSACSGSPSGPTSSTVGSVTDISGAWKGTFASSNNESVPIQVAITQNGSAISATWSGDVIAWSGNVTGTLDGSSMNAQLSFKGVAGDSTVCTGTATATGTASATAITLTSANGVIGGSCPAPLPTGIRIDLHR
jgi:hypothetical protein